MPTASERLTALMMRASPRLAEICPQVEAGGRWPDGAAPYTWHVAGDRRRIALTIPETGETIMGTGETRDEALDALERRVLQMG